MECDILEGDFILINIWIIGTKFLVWNKNNKIIPGYPLPSETSPF